MFKQDNLPVDNEESQVARKSHTIPWFCCTTANTAAYSYCIILSFKRKKVTKASEEGAWPRNEIQ